MDLSQVTLTQMRYAVSVEELQNFRLAAERCHVSQSGLSMQIKKLEELLDVSLFDRSKKPVLVTLEGRAVIAQLRNVLRETQRLGQVASEQEEPAGAYRLGVIPTLSATVLPLFLAEFIEQYPRVELVIEELKTTDIIARLQADTLDAGVAATPLSVNGLQEEVLGAETLVAYLPLGDALLRKKSIPQGDLESRQLWVMPEGHCFRSQVLSYCRSGKPPAPGRVHFESGSFETLIQLVDEGLGATVLPALVAQRLTSKKQSEQVRPLVSPRPVREIGLVTARSDFRRRVSEALVDLIKRKLADKLGPLPRKPLVLDPLPR